MKTSGMWSRERWVVTSQAEFCLRSGIKCFFYPWTAVWWQHKRSNAYRWVQVQVLYCQFNDDDWECAFIRKRQLCPTKSGWRMWGWLCVLMLSCSDKFTEASYQPRTHCCPLKKTKWVNWAKKRNLKVPGLMVQASGNVSGHLQLKANPRREVDPSKD